MKDKVIRLARLFPAQGMIVKHPARFKVLACGRRFGKTAVAVDILCNHLLEGHAVAYFAPTYRMTKEVMGEMERILRPVIARTRLNDFRYDLITGGVLEFWPLGTAGEAVRGRKYHFAVVDEAALVASGEVWHAAIRPLLTDYQGGALFASTPRGRNWFWQLFQLGQDPTQRDWMSWHYPTTANPYIQPGEVEAARTSIPERVFRQEFLAEFLDDGGAVFRGIDRVCVGQYEPAREGGSYVFGVDWGRSNDFTAIAVFDAIHKRMVALDRFNQISWQAQRDRLAGLWEQYRPFLILAEENSIGSVNIEALQMEGLPVRPFTTTRESKRVLIEGLGLAIEREAVVLLDDAILKGELAGYAMEQTGTGWRYGAPAGLHDDTVMAAALGWAAADSYRTAPILDWW